MAKQKADQQSPADNQPAEGSTQLATPGATSTGLTLAKVGEYRLAKMPASELQDVLASVAENVGPGGFSERDLTRVKIPSAGSTAWQLPVIGSDEPQVVTSLEGVIVGKKRVRVMWDKVYGDGPVEPPVCTSNDGITGVGKYAAKCGGLCAKCPMSQFNSKSQFVGKPSKAQACQLREVLFVLMEGDIIPKVISAPPSSLQNVRDYMMQLSSVGKPFYGVLTKFKLRKEKNDGGIEYAEVVPVFAGVLPPEVFGKYKAYADQFKPMFTGMSAIEVLPEDIVDNSETPKPGTNPGNVNPENGELVQ